LRPCSWLHCVQVSFQASCLSQASTATRGGKATQRKKASVKLYAQRNRERPARWRRHRIQGKSCGSSLQQSHSSTFALSVKLLWPAP
jgi:hypothetical protein